MTPIEPWSADRLSDLADLWNEASPGEPLVEDELEPCWRSGSLVLGHDDGVVVAHTAGPRGFLDLIAVRPGARRSGIGRALVDAACGELEAAGATTVQAGGSVPWYLWPGVDAADTAAMALAEACGFGGGPVAPNMVLDVRWQVGDRAPRSAPGVRVERLEPSTAAAVVAAVEREHPRWVDEVGRGVDQATAHGAFREGEPLGVGTHSVNRLGWIGPMATFAAGRGSGVGSVVLAALCRDLASAGYREAEVAWVGPVRFYAKVAGARMGRTFVARRRHLTRPASAP